MSGGPLQASHDAVQQTPCGSVATYVVVCGRPERALRPQKAVPYHSCMHHIPHGVSAPSRVGCLHVSCMCTHTLHTHTQHTTRRHVRARVTYMCAHIAIARYAHAHTRRGITMPSCRCPRAPICPQRLMLWPRPARQSCLTASCMLQAGSPGGNIASSQGGKQAWFWVKLCHQAKVMMNSRTCLGH